MAFPTPYTVGRGSFTTTAGANGYEGEPDYSGIIPVAVIGWAPLASSMPVGVELTARIIGSLMLMVPPAGLADWHPLDHVWLDGTVNDDVEFVPTNLRDFYVISEDVRDFTTGPFGYQPGGAVILERVQG